MPNDAMAILRNNYDPKPVADLPLIPWDEVPEGPVWIREKDRPGKFALARKSPGGLYLSVYRLTPSKYYFAAAEQQPGEWAVKVAELRERLAETDAWRV